jgi:hypothetical protein
VPGGRAAYPSSVLMNVIPARVAGVDEIVMVTPTPGRRAEPAVLAAAHVAGVDEVLPVGGAQAVAALAYGTETIEPVDKIVGPGNRWVAEAKRQVFGWVDIDMVAGPSEILVLADDDRRPAPRRGGPDRPGGARPRRHRLAGHRRAGAGRRRAGRARALLPRTRGATSRARRWRRTG